jgi:hypothetical protein
MAGGETTLPDRQHAAGPRGPLFNAREVAVKKLPIWIVTTLFLLGIITTYVGWIDRHEVGYLPFALGVVWILFSLASAPRIFADD